MEKKEKIKRLGINLEYSNGLVKYVSGDTVDELIEGLEYLNDSRFINEFVSESPELTPKQYERLDHIMLKSNSATQLCRYVRQRKKISNLKEFVNKLIDLKAFEQLIDLMKIQKGINPVKVEEAIIESGNTKAMVKFYAEFGTSFENKIRDIFFEKKAVEDIYNFFREKDKKEKNVDLNERYKAEKIIIESGNAKMMRLWTVNIKCSSIVKMQEAISTSKNAEEIFQFAKDVEGSDKHKLRKAIMETKDAYWIKQWKAYFGIKGLFF